MNETEDSPFDADGPAEVGTEMPGNKTGAAPFYFLLPGAADGNKFGIHKRKE